jgi:SAM-dependent methyltransferase
MSEPDTPQGDYFSAQAEEYARYRPHYPDELFAYLASTTAHRHLAWDCATGSGQAAVPLAAYFDRVVATDISSAQIEHARIHERVEYRVAPAEASGLGSATANLVTVSQALHWLDLGAFYREVERVLAPGGVLAVSSYGSASVDDPELSAIFAHFEWTTLGAYWPPRRALVGDKLREMPFPFPELAVPDFRLEASWTLTELVGYARSWSAAARYVARHGRDPTAELEASLRESWGDPDRRRLVRWPFVVRVGRLPGTRPVAVREASNDSARVASSTSSVVSRVVSRPSSAASALAHSRM